MKIAVVIPAYNESKHIKALLEQMPQFINGHELCAIVVDDGSKDDTSRHAKSVKGVTVLRHVTNLGKGAAAKTGCDAACKMKADVIVLMDGDGQHRVNDIPKMVAPVLESRSALVIGSRPRCKAMPMTMRFANWSLSFLSQMLFNIHVRDTQSGFRAFPAEIYPQIRWRSSDYGMETEMLILSTYRRIPCHEVEIDTIYLDNFKGTTVVDGLRILRTLLKWRLLWSREFKSLESFLV
ncbi:MAG: glycosyltransferase family 2 protein [Patescibacteria group bacterium]|jgi:glycosyltransferase involved in cell wall biosynthesis